MAFEQSSPYEQVAVSLRDRILDGSLASAKPSPPVKQLAREHGVSVGNVQRAVVLLKDWGLVDVMYGRRTLVRQHINPEDRKDVAAVGSEEKMDAAVAVPSNPKPLDLEIRRLAGG